MNWDWINEICSITMHGTLSVQNQPSNTWDNKNLFKKTIVYSKSALKS